MLFSSTFYQKSITNWNKNKLLVSSPISKAQDVTHHGHHCQGACVIGPSVKPNLWGNQSAFRSTCRAQHSSRSADRSLSLFSYGQNGHLTSELGLLSHSSLARSSPAVLLTACSNTSTFSISVRWS